MIANRKNEYFILKNCISENHIDTYGDIGIGKTKFFGVICTEIIPANYLPVHIILPYINSFNEFIELIGEELDSIFHKERHFFPFIDYVDETEGYHADTAARLLKESLYKAVDSINIALCFDGTEKVNFTIWDRPLTAFL